MVWLVGVQGSFFGISWWLRETHSMHFHHYTGSMMALPLLWFPHPWTTFNLGFANGVMIEGVARWGYDAHWIPKVKA